MNEVQYIYMVIYNHMLQQTVLNTLWICERTIECTTRGASSSTTETMDDSTIKSKYCPRGPVQNKHPSFFLLAGNSESTLRENNCSLLLLSRWEREKSSWTLLRIIIMIIMLYKWVALVEQLIDTAFIFVSGYESLVYLQMFLPFW